MFSAARRLAAAAAAAAAAKPKPKQEIVPDVLVSFGNQADRITFVSHPGVMAVSKLLEMAHITQYRALLTQEDVEAIAKYDQDLARKAQIAVDEGLAVNFQDLQYFDNSDFVEKFKKEKEILGKIKEEVLKAPKGQYAMPEALKEYETPMAPRSMRPELKISQEILEKDKKLKFQEEVSDAVKEFISNCNKSTNKQIQ